MGVLLFLNKHTSVHQLDIKEHIKPYVHTIPKAQPFFLYWDGMFKNYPKVMLNVLEKLEGNVSKPKCGFPTLCYDFFYFFLKSLFCELSHVNSPKKLYFAIHTKMEN